MNNEKTKPHLNAFMVTGTDDISESMEQNLEFQTQESMESWH